MIDPQANRMHTAKKTFNGRGGIEGNTNELITVTRTSRDVHPPTARFMIRSRAEVSPNRGLLSRPPLVPYVLVVKSSMGVSADLHSGQICPLSAVRPPRNTAPVPHASKLASGTHKRRCPFWNLCSLPYILPYDPCAVSVENMTS